MGVPDTVSRESEQGPDDGSGVGSGSNDQCGRVNMYREAEKEPW